MSCGHEALDGALVICPQLGVRTHLSDDQIAQRYVRSVQKAEAILARDMFIQGLVAMDINVPSVLR